MLDNMHQKWAVIFSDLCIETAKTSGYSNGFSQISKDQLRWPQCLDGNGRKSDRISGNRDPWRKKYIYIEEKNSQDCWCRDYWNTIMRDVNKCLDTHGHVNCWSFSIESNNKDWTLNFRTEIYSTEDFTGIDVYGLPIGNYGLSSAVSSNYSQHKYFHCYVADYTTYHLKTSNSSHLTVSLAGSSAQVLIN